MRHDICHWARVWYSTSTTFMLGSAVEPTKLQCQLRRCKYFACLPVPCLLFHPLTQSCHDTPSGLAVSNALLAHNGDYLLKTDCLGALYLQKKKKKRLLFWHKSGSTGVCGSFLLTENRLLFWHKSGSTGVCGSFLLTENRQFPCNPKRKTKIQNSRKRQHRLVTSLFAAVLH